MKFNLKERMKAFAFHLLASGVVLTGAGWVFYRLWYPGTLITLSDGFKIFLLILVVDLILGPSLLFLVFNTKKPRKELVRDVSIIILIQIAALIYGVWTGFNARPVAIVFEYDRFRIVHANEVVGLAPQVHKNLFFYNKPVFSLKKIPGSERERLFFEELGGVPLAAQTSLWQSYQSAKEGVMQSAKHFSEAAIKHPEITDESLHDLKNSEDFNINDAGLLVIIGRNGKFGTVVIDKKNGNLLKILVKDYLNF